MVFALEHKLFEIVMALFKGDIGHSPLLKLSKGKKSPVVIPFEEVENAFIIYYPPNSEHYVDQWDGLKKLCKILDGTIYEATEKRTYTKGDEFVIEAGRTYDPYTINGHCIAFVKKIE
jgi:hypothetical protein